MTEAQNEIETGHSIFNRLSFDETVATMNAPKYSYNDNNIYLHEREILMSQKDSHHHVGDSDTEQQQMEPFENTEQQLLESKEPDWDTMAMHAPANKDIPVFLAARERRREAERLLGLAIDAAFEDLTHSAEDIVQCVLDLYHANNHKLDDAEMEIQQLLESNEGTRSELQQKLEESALATRAEIHRLLLKVTTVASRH